MTKPVLSHAANQQLTRLVSTYNTASSKRTTSFQRNSKKQLASLVTKRVKLEMDKSSEELKTQADTKAYIMSLIQEAAAPGTKSQPSVASSVTHTLLR
jgi:hypothetical protein